jgi:hypothetical protein
MLGRPRLRVMNSVSSHRTKEEAAAGAAEGLAAGAAAGCCLLLLARRQTSVALMGLEEAGSDGIPPWAAYVRQRGVQFTVLWVP